MDAFECPDKYIVQLKKVMGTDPNPGDVYEAIMKESDEVQNVFNRLTQAKSDAMYEHELERLVEGLCDLSYVSLLALRCFRSGDWQDIYIANHEEILKRISKEKGNVGILPAGKTGKLSRFFQKTAFAKTLAQNLIRRM